MSRLDETRPFHPVRIAVLTVTDTRDASNDTSGDALVARITEAGHELADRDGTFLAFAETFPAEVLLLPILASFFGQKLPHSTGLAKEPSVGIIKK